MSERYSSRFSQRSSRGHVRRPQQQSFPSWMIWLFALLGLLAIAALVREVVNRLNDEESIVTVQSNRLWLGDEWTLNAATSEQVETLVNRLQENQIKAIYVVTGAWRADNQYRSHDFAEQFREQMQDAASDIKVLAWIWYEPELHANDTSETSLVSYARTALDDWNYDGIHLQGFSIPNRNERYIQLVRALEVITENKILSITVPPDHIPTDPVVPKGRGNPTFSWEPSYKQQMALIADEMVIMPHASGLTAPNEYEAWVAYQVETYARDVSRMEVETDLIIGLPAYPEEALHDPTIENVTTAINGTRQGLADAGDARDYVVGAGLYSFSTASEDDWLQFKSLWVR